MVLFLKSLLDQSPRGRSNAFEKRSDEDVRTRTVLTSLRAVATKEWALGTLNE
jgi:hypothetical protein